MKKIEKVIKEKKWCKAAAKLQIANLLNQHPGGMDQLDIADALCVPLMFACKLCDEMLKEKKIKTFKS